MAITFKSKVGNKVQVILSKLLYFHKGDNRQIFFQI